MASETFRMNTTYIYGMLLGGTVVSALGGAAEYMKEKQMPSYKSMIRDFLVGAILVLFLLQIVPDSMENLVSALPALPNLATVTSGSLDPDLQVGPARFQSTRVEMEQKSQVWWSFPGGIGWPTPIPLKGGKRKTRKGRKSSKKTRKGRKGATRRR